jgi:mono/diheme cytochrome c family protein
MSGRYTLLIAPLAVSLIFIAETGRGQTPTPPEQGKIVLGKAIYDARCVSCHGKDGKGDGGASGYLTPRPRNLTAGKFKYRSTESGSIPTDDDLLNSIRNGLHGTAMPDWKPFLNGDSLMALLQYVKSLSPRFQNETPKAVHPGAPVAASPSSIASGRKVYERLECASCHGSDGAGKDAIATDLQDDDGHSISATNLTEGWTFRGGATSADIYLRFRTGIDGTPMPSFLGSATDHEMWDLANYVVSLSRKPVWSMNGEEIKALYAMQDEAAKQHPVERGKYLVSTLGCTYCHTPANADGSPIEALWLAGGTRMNLYPFDDVVTYNLTSDKETGLGAWTDDQIKTFITKGVRRDGSRMIPYPMPWPAFALMKTEDLNAIVAYLRTLPPVYNKIPDPKSPGFFSYMWGKFQALILKKDFPIHVYSGNAGTTREKGISSDMIPSHRPTVEDQP